MFPVCVFSLALCLAFTIAGADEEPGAVLVDFAFSARGEDGALRLYAVDGRREVHSLLEFRDNPLEADPVLAPDGRHVAVGVVTNERSFLQMITVRSCGDVEERSLFEGFLVQELSWSADSRYLAVVCGRELPYALLILDTSSFEVETLDEFTVYSPWFQWSVDGHKLLYVKDDSVCIAEPPATAMHTLPLAGHGPVWDEEARGIITCGREIVRVAPGAGRETLFPGIFESAGRLTDEAGFMVFPGRFHGITWSADRKKAVLCLDTALPQMSSWRLAYFFIDIEKQCVTRLQDTLQIVQEKRLSGFSRMHCAFSTDSGTLACGFEGAILLMEVKTEAVRRLARAGWIFQAPCFSADNRGVFFTGFPEGRPQEQAVFFARTDGGEISRINDGMTGP